MRITRRLAAVAIAILTLAAIVAATPAPTSAHHSGTCDVSSPMVTKTWGCTKHGRVSSTFGYVQLDDTHTNGRGIYAYSVRSTDASNPSKWDWAAAWGGDKKTIWFTAPWAIDWIAYCDGAKWSNGANCVLKSW